MKASRTFWCWGKRFGFLMKEDLLLQHSFLWAGSSSVHRNPLSSPLINEAHRVSHAKCFPLSGIVPHHISLPYTHPATSLLGPKGSPLPRLLQELLNLADMWQIHFWKAMGWINQSFQPKKVNIKCSMWGILTHSWMFQLLYSQWNHKKRLSKCIAVQVNPLYPSSTILPSVILPYVCRAPLKTD